MGALDKRQANETSVRVAIAYDTSYIYNGNITDSFATLPSVELAEAEIEGTVDFQIRKVGETAVRTVKAGASFALPFSNLNLFQIKAVAGIGTFEIMGGK